MKKLVYIIIFLISIVGFSQNQVETSEIFYSANKTVIGNLGVSIEPYPGYNTQNNKLFQLFGNTSGGYGIPGISFVKNNHSYKQGGSILWVSNNFTSDKRFAQIDGNLENGNGRIQFLTRSSTDSDGVFRRMVFDHTGSLGIGITSPEDMLHIKDVSGEFKFGRPGSEMNNRFTLDASSGYENQIYFRSAQGRIFTSGGLLTLSTSSSPDVVIASSGNIGIGTSDPVSKMEVDGDITINNLGGTIMRTGVFGASSDHAGTYNRWIKMGEMTLNGNWNDTNLTLDFYPWNAKHGDSRQQINISIRNNTSGIEGTYDINLITFYGRERSIRDVKLVHTSGSGVSNNRISIWVQMATSHVYNVPFKAYYSGNIDLEFTNQPHHASITESGTIFNVNSSYGMYGSQFEVAGTIRSQEVKVEASPWPDYVFEEDYDLPTIESIEKFIQSNKHLPDVPSAEEVEAEGLKLGEMNALLLKKIEELTLYVIELKKENDEQSTQMAQQQVLIDQLISEKK